MVELKLNGEYVYCHVVQRRPGFVTVIVPSGIEKEFPVERIVG